MLHPSTGRLGYLGELPIKYIPPEKVPVADLKELINERQFHIVIRKTTFDVFDNPNTVELLNIVRPQGIVVFGVTTDVCVYMTVRGLLGWGAAEVIVLKDAVKGIGVRTDEQVFDEFRRNGAKIVNFADLEKEL